MLFLLLKLGIQNRRYYNCILEGMLVRVLLAPLLGQLLVEVLVEVLLEVLLVL
jgi:hypothetical protein